MARPRAPIKSVRKTLADGTCRRYFYDRASGERLDAETEEAALALVTARTAGMGKPGTIAALIDLYLASRDFAAKRPSTQEFYRTKLGYIRVRAGHLPLTAMTPARVQTIKEQLAEQPAKANGVLAVLSIVFELARRRGLVAINPAIRPGKLRVASRTGIWSDEEVTRCLAALRPSLKLAFMLLLCTAQRPSDMLAMTKGQVATGEDGRLYIKLRQQKTGERTGELIAVPVHAELDPLLRARLADPAGGLLLVPSPRGRPWARRNFSRAWDHDLAAAGRAWASALAAEGWQDDQIAAAQQAAHRQRRDLRRTAMVRMAQAGATIRDIAAVSGHTIDVCQKIIETYIPRRTEQALRAIEAWERAGATASTVVRLADHVVLRGDPVAASVNRKPIGNRKPETRDRNRKPNDSK